MNKERDICELSDILVGKRIVSFEYNVSGDGAICLLKTDDGKIVRIHGNDCGSWFEEISCYECQDGGWVSGPECVECNGKGSTGIHAPIMCPWCNGHGTMLKPCVCWENKKETEQ
jgi:hypothetical protein